MIGYNAIVTCLILYFVLEEGKSRDNLEPVFIAVIILNIIKIAWNFLS